MSEISEKKNALGKQKQEASSINEHNNIKQ